MMGRRRTILFVPPSRDEGATGPREGAEGLAPFDAEERGEWTWIQPRRMHRQWQLEAGGRPVATLEGSRGLGRVFHAVFAQDTFVMRHGLTGGLEVRRDPDGEVLLRFVNHFFGGGHFECAGGERLELKRLNWFSFAFEVRTEDGFVQLRARPRRGFLRHEATLEPEESGRRRPDLPLLMAVAGVLATLPPRHSHG